MTEQDWIVTEDGIILIKTEQPGRYLKLDPKPETMYPPEVLEVLPDEGSQPCVRSVLETILDQQEQ